MVEDGRVGGRGKERGKKIGREEKGREKEIACK
jgi:hypothetical protein